MKLTLVICCVLVSLVALSMLSEAGAPGKKKGKAKADIEKAKGAKDKREAVNKENAETPKGKQGPKEKKGAKKAVKVEEPAETTKAKQPKKVVKRSTITEALTEDEASAVEQAEVNSDFMEQKQAKSKPKKVRKTTVTEEIEQHEEEVLPDPEKPKKKNKTTAKKSCSAAEYAVIEEETLTDNGNPRSGGYSRLELLEEPEPRIIAATEHRDHVVLKPSDATLGEQQQQLAKNKKFVVRKLPKGVELVIEVTPNEVLLKSRKASPPVAAKIPTGPILKPAKVVVVTEEIDRVPATVNADGSEEPSFLGRSKGSAGDQSVGY